VHATVLGDVPYSVDGFRLLVVGDGRPAATPDPDGVLARRSLPESLTVREVRALQPEDPISWAEGYRYDAVVLECRDGDRRVRIAMRRADAPVVLGALAAAPIGSGAAPGGSADHADQAGHGRSRTPRTDGA